MNDLTIALSGNPNSGKTTIFNNMTGANQKVGNWPGVTVEKKEGKLNFRGESIRVVDLPGTYSLTPFSIEEVTARDFIQKEKPDVVISIIDSSNLERSLYLATQVLELGRPIVFALNMADVAKSRGIQIDADRLSKLLNLPVVFTVGNKNQGTDNLIQKAFEEAAAFKKGKKARNVKYSNDIEACLESVTATLETDFDNSPELVRWTAAKLLEGDEIIWERYRDKGRDDVLRVAEKCRKRIEGIYHDDVETVLTEDRYGFIAGIYKEVVHFSRRKRVDISKNIDLVLTNRLLGFPIFILFIWAMFQLTFSLGAYPMEWINTGVMVSADLADRLMAPSILEDLLLDGIVAGIGSVIVFLPNILILFFCIALFEDTGYMARAAFLMDRIMHAIGLHGKSFIPMLMGFGCTVPAVMAARTLENPKDRILTILLTPFMSCSARLPVYIVLAGTFFPENGGTVIFCLYFTGILAAMISGRIFRSTLLKGEDAPFVMELPPYRAPMIKSLLIHMWDRSKMFLKKMGGVILVGSIIIWVLSYFPRNAAISADYTDRINDLRAPYAQTDISGVPEQVREKIETLRKMEKKEQVEQSYIGRLGKSLEPVFRPIGIEWRESVALVTGLVAKEVVVSTLGVLHGVDNERTNALKEALRHSGMTPLSALSLMVFVLLYVPCIATISAIWKEASGKWAVFNLFYTTLVAWGASFLIYQAGMMLGAG